MYCLLMLFTAVFLHLQCILLLHYWFAIYQCHLALYLSRTTVTYSLMMIRSPEPAESEHGIKMEFVFVSFLGTQER